MYVAFFALLMVAVAIAPLKSHYFRASTKRPFFLTCFVSFVTCLATTFTLSSFFVSVPVGASLVVEAVCFSSLVASLAAKVHVYLGGSPLAFLFLSVIVALSASLSVALLVDLDAGLFVATVLAPGVAPLIVFGGLFLYAVWLRKRDTEFILHEQGACLAVSLTLICCAYALLCLAPFGTVTIEQRLVLSAGHFSAYIFCCVAPLLLTDEGPVEITPFRGSISTQSFKE